MTLAPAAATAASVVPGPRLCLDCGTALSGKFCAACGQKDEPLKRSLKDLALEFFQHPLIDTKLWRSLGQLLRRPGALTLEYLGGRRTRYVRPLKLYLTVSVLFFALFALRVPATQAFRVQMDTEPAPGTAASKKDRPHFPIAWLDKRFERNTAALEGPEGAAAREALSRRIAGLAPKMVFVLLPLSAILFKLFWWKRYFVEHLVFTLHLHTFIFAAALLTLLPWGPVLGVFFLWSAAYALLAFKRVYRMGWGVTVAKLLGVFLAYLVLFSAVMLVTTFSALLAA